MENEAKTSQINVEGSERQSVESDEAGDGQSGQSTKLADLFPNGMNVTVQGDKVTVESTPEWDAYVATKAQNEMARQLMYGLPPSKGMPDVRPRYPRYDPERQSGE